ncbi:MAG: hypothetical protein KatS3mg115_1571 [Candidatus Poribacteria bacterium]|nr:MAG: hypothetical protein KatS3mg115_1571 [Candidatus Poribacteria bacterium]
MGAFFSTLGTQIRQLWQNLVLWQRIALVAVLALVPIVLIWLTLALQPEYVTLYTNLTQSDQLLIDQALTEAGIRHVIDPADNSLKVRPEDEGKARLLLAQEGLPHMPVEGYQIFDRQRLGATEFEQRLNFKRALEDELKRRLETLDVVLRAEVDLVIPTPTVFTEREKPPTASVTITPHARHPTDAGADRRDRADRRERR